MRARLALVGLVVPMMLMGCSGGENPTQHPDWSPIIAKAPHAYTGKCRVEQVNGKWLQPEIDNSGTSRKVPVSCFNLYGHVGTYVSPVPQAGKRFILITESHDGGGVETDKLWIKVEPQPAGAWLITWGAKAGVRVEWLLATVDTKDEYISASAGRYEWHPSRGMTYPKFSVFANDLDVADKTPVGITGPPVPHP